MGSLSTNLYDTAFWETASPASLRTRAVPEVWQANLADVSAWTAWDPIAPSLGTGTLSGGAGGAAFSVSANYKAWTPNAYPAYSDFRINATMSFSSFAATAMIVGYLERTSDQSYVTFGTWSGSHRLNRRTNGANSVLASGSSTFTVSAGNEYQVELTMRQGQYEYRAWPSNSSRPSAANVAWTGTLSGPWSLGSFRSSGTLKSLSVENLGAAEHSSGDTSVRVPVASLRAGSTIELVESDHDAGLSVRATLIRDGVGGEFRRQNGAWVQISSPSYDNAVALADLGELPRSELTHVKLYVRVPASSTALALEALRIRYRYLD